MTISENAVHQIAHFSSTGFIMMLGARRAPIIFVLAAIVLGSAIKEFGFDHKTQTLQGQLEDFVFLAAGGFVAALLIVLFPIY